MDRSWGFFGRGLLLLGASWGASGLRQASGSDFVRILEPFGGAKSMFFRFVSTRRGGCFCTCLSCSFACAGALKFVLFALGAKRASEQIHRKKHCVLMNFQCSRACRGRREEGMRNSKREPKLHTKNTTTTTNKWLFQGPGPSL